MSLLSARRAKASPAKYIPNIAHTVARTTKFLVSPSRVNSVKTFSKSMGLGEIRMFPPNAERCVHKQCRFPLTSFHPTLKRKNRKNTLNESVYAVRQPVSEKPDAIYWPLFPHRRNEPANFRSKNIRHIKMAFS